MAQAAPGFANNPTFSLNPQSLSFEGQTAIVGEIRDQKQGRLILHIQDAHANTGAQKNIAKVLEQAVEKYGVKTVFVEGGSKDNSLNELRSLAAKPIRLRVGEKYLENGVISGAEYLSLASDLDFHLRGIENKDLYRQNLNEYAAAAKSREKAQSSLAELQKRTDSLKAVLYSREIFELDRALSDPNKNFSEIYERLQDFSRKYSVNLLPYPNFLALKNLKQADHKTDEAFIKEASDIDFPRLLSELESIQEAIYSAALQSEEAATLYQIDRHLARLKSLFSLQIEPADFQAYLNAKENGSFHLLAILAFLNRQFYDRNRFEDILKYDPLLPDYEKNAVQFYLTARERDRAFMENIRRSWKEPVAVVITGGFHTDGLKKLFNEQGFSYAVVSPRVSHETNLKNYEKGLLSASTIARSLITEGARLADWQRLRRDLTSAIILTGALALAPTAAKAQVTPEEQAAIDQAAVAHRIAQYEVAVDVLNATFLPVRKWTGPVSKEMESLENLLNTHKPEMIKDLKNEIERMKRESTLPSDKSASENLALRHAVMIAEAASKRVPQLDTLDEVQKAQGEIVRGIQALALNYPFNPADASVGKRLNALCVKYEAAGLMRHEVLLRKNPTDRTLRASMESIFSDLFGKNEEDFLVWLDAAATDPGATELAMALTEIRFKKLVAAKKDGEAIHLKRWLRAQRWPSAEPLKRVLDEMEKIRPVQKNEQSPNEPNRRDPKAQDGVDVGARLALTKEEQKAQQKELREQHLFKHIDGVGIVSTVDAMDRAGVFDIFRNAEQAGSSISASEIINEIKHKRKARGESERVNDGYILIALHALCLQGWIERKGAADSLESTYKLTAEGKISIDYVSYYTAAMKFTETAIDMDAFLFEKSPRGPPTGKSDSTDNFYRLVENSKNDWGLPKGLNKDIRQKILRQLNGYLIAPALLTLRDRNDEGLIGINDKEPTLSGLRTTRFAGRVLERLKKYPTAHKFARSLFIWMGWIASYNNAFDISKMNGNTGRLRMVMGLLEKQGWVNEVQGNLYQFNEKGKYIFDLAWSYGVPVSYLRLYAKLDQLFFGEAKEVFKRDKYGDETHVNRRLNVKGSGAAHRAYFDALKKMVEEVFNTDDFDSQPKIVSDMGAGDGSFLKFIYDTVKNTKRGAVLKDYPLHFVAADVNKEAYQLAEQKLLRAGVDRKYVHAIEADINKLDDYRVKLMDEIARIGDPRIRITDVMHVSSMLVHNRPIELDENLVPAFEPKQLSQAAFATTKGEIIPSDWLTQNLIEHFKSWQRLTEGSTHPIFLIELHTVLPEAAKDSLAISYYTSHGYSNQVNVEALITDFAMRQAGFLPIMTPFPGKEGDRIDAKTAVTVSKLVQFSSITPASQALSPAAARLAYQSPVKEITGFSPPLDKRVQRLPELSRESFFYVKFDRPVDEEDIQVMVHCEFENGERADLPPVSVRHNGSHDGGTTQEYYAMLPAEVVKYTVGVKVNGVEKGWLSLPGIDGLPGYEGWERLPLSQRWIEIRASEGAFRRWIRFGQRLSIQALRKIAPSLLPLLTFRYFINSALENEANAALRDFHQKDQSQPWVVAAVFVGNRYFVVLDRKLEDKTEQEKFERQFHSYFQERLKRFGIKAIENGEPGTAAEMVVESELSDLSEHNFDAFIRANLFEGSPSGLKNKNLGVASGIHKDVLRITAKLRERMKYILDLEPVEKGYNQLTAQAVGLIQEKLAVKDDEQEKKGKFNGLLFVDGPSGVGKTMFMSESLAPVMKESMPVSVLDTDLFLDTPERRNHRYEEVVAANKPYANEYVETWRVAYLEAKTKEILDFKTSEGDPNEVRNFEIPDAYVREEQAMRTVTVPVTRGGVLALVGKYAQNIQTAQAYTGKKISIRLGDAEVNLERRFLARNLREHGNGPYYDVRQRYFALMEPSWKEYERRTRESVDYRVDLAVSRAEWTLVAVKKAKGARLIAATLPLAENLSAREYVAKLKADPSLLQNTVLIVGAGPAGLKAAHGLIQKEYNVILFDRNTDMGGLGLFGIPPFNRPGHAQLNLKMGVLKWARKVVVALVAAASERMSADTQKNIDDTYLYIEQNVRTSPRARFFFSVDIGKDLTLDELTSLADAAGRPIPVILATGAQSPERPADRKNFKNIVSATSEFFFWVNNIWLLEMRKRLALALRAPWIAPRWVPGKKNHVIGAGNVMGDTGLHLRRIDETSEITAYVRGASWALDKIDDGYLHPMLEKGVKIQDLVRVEHYLDKDGDGNADHVVYRRRRIIGLEVDAQGHSQKMPHSNTGIPMELPAGKSLQDLGVPTKAYYYAADDEKKKRPIEWPGDFKTIQTEIEATDKQIQDEILARSKKKEAGPAPEAAHYVYKFIVEDIPLTDEVRARMNEENTEATLLVPADFIVEATGDNAEPIGDLKTSGGAFVMDKQTGKIREPNLYGAGQAVTKRGRLTDSWASADEAVAKVVQNYPTVGARLMATFSKIAPPEPILSTRIHEIKNGDRQAGAWANFKSTVKRDQARAVLYYRDSKTPADSRSWPTMDAEITDWPAADGDATFYFRVTLPVDVVEYTWKVSQDGGKTWSWFSKPNENIIVKSASETKRRREKKILASLPTLEHCDIGTSQTWTREVYSMHTGKRIKQDVREGRYLMLAYDEAAGVFNLKEIGRSTYDKLNGAVQALNKNEKLMKWVREYKGPKDNLKLYLVEHNPKSAMKNYPHFLYVLGKNFQLAYSKTEEGREQSVYLTLPAFTDLIERDPDLLADILMNQIEVAQIRCQYARAGAPYVKGKMSTRVQAINKRIRKEGTPLAVDLRRNQDEETRVSQNYYSIEMLMRKVAAELEEVAKKDMPGFSPALTNYKRAVKARKALPNYDISIYFWGLMTYALQDLAHNADDPAYKGQIKAYLENLSRRGVDQDIAAVNRMFEEYILNKDGKGSQVRDRGISNLKGEWEGTAKGRVVVVRDIHKIDALFREAIASGNDDIIWIVPYLPDRYLQIPGKAIITSVMAGSHALDAAKNQGIPYAIIPNACELLKEYDSKTGFLRIEGRDVRFRTAEEGDAGEPAKKLAGSIRIPKPRLDGPLWYPLSMIDENSICYTGAKASDLGALKHAGFNVPDGFVLPYAFWEKFKTYNNLGPMIEDYLGRIQTQEMPKSEGNRIIVMSADELDVILHEIQRRIRIAEFGPELSGELERAVSGLCQRNNYPSVDPNVVGEQVKRVFASAFNPLAVQLYFNYQKNFEGRKITPAVLVQIPIKAKYAGTIRTMKTTSDHGDRNVLVVKASHGQGAAVVGTKGQPAEIEVSKLHGTVTAIQNESWIDGRYKIRKPFLYTRSSMDAEDTDRLLTPGFFDSFPGKPETGDPDPPLEVELVTPEERETQIFSDVELVGRLREEGEKVEAYFGYRPQDIEWAVDESGTLYILQSRSLRTTPWYAEIGFDEEILGYLENLDAKTLYDLKASSLSKDQAAIQYLIAGLQMRDTLNFSKKDPQEKAKFARRIVAAKYLGEIGGDTAFAQNVTLEQVQQIAAFAEAGMNLYQLGLYHLLICLRKLDSTTSREDIKAEIHRFFEVLSMKKYVLHLVNFEIAKYFIANGRYDGLITDNDMSRLKTGPQLTQAPDVADRTLRILDTMPLSVMGPRLDTFRQQKDGATWLKVYAERIYQRHIQSEGIVSPSAPTVPTTPPVPPTTPVAKPHAGNALTVQTAADAVRDLEGENLAGKRILVRVDFDHEKGSLQIIDRKRLQVWRPLVDFLLRKKAIVILMGKHTPIVRDTGREPMEAIESEIETMFPAADVFAHYNSLNINGVRGLMRKDFSADKDKAAIHILSNLNDAKDVDRESFTQRDAFCRSLVSVTDGIYIYADVAAMGAPDITSEMLPPYFQRFYVGPAVADKRRIDEDEDGGDADLDAARLADAAQPATPVVLTEKSADGTGWIRLNRPDKANSISMQMLRELKEAVLKLDADPAVDKIILTGQGRFFSAGADFSEAGQDRGPLFNDAYNAIEDCKKPVIAFLNGSAYGGGMEMALAAHYRIAVKNAKLSLPETGIGFIPGAGGTWRIMEKVDSSFAKEMLLLGKEAVMEGTGSYEAKRVGLVNEVIETPADLEQAVSSALRRNVIKKTVEAKPVSGEPIYTFKLELKENGLAWISIHPIQDRTQMDSLPSLLKALNEDSSTRAVAIESDAANLITNDVREAIRDFSKPSILVATQDNGEYDSVSGVFDFSVVTLRDLAASEVNKIMAALDRVHPVSFVLAKWAMTRGQLLSDRAAKITTERIGFREIVRLEIYKEGISKEALEKKKRGLLTYSWDVPAMEKAMTALRTVSAARLAEDPDWEKARALIDRATSVTRESLMPTHIIFKLYEGNEQIAEIKYFFASIHGDESLEVRVPPITTFDLVKIYDGVPFLKQALENKAGSPRGTAAARLARTWMNTLERQQLVAVLTGGRSPFHLDQSLGLENLVAHGEGIAVEALTGVEEAFPDHRLSKVSVMWDKAARFGGVLDGVKIGDVLTSNFEALEPRAGKIRVKFWVTKQGAAKNALEGIAELVPLEAGREKRLFLSAEERETKLAAILSKLKAPEAQIFTAGKKGPAFWPEPAMGFNITSGSGLTPEYLEAAAAWHGATTPSPELLAVGMVSFACSQNVFDPHVRLAGFEANFDANGPVFIHDMVRLEKTSAQIQSRGAKDWVTLTFNASKNNKALFDATVLQVKPAAARLSKATKEFPVDWKYGIHARPSTILSAGAEALKGAFQGFSIEVRSKGSAVNGESVFGLLMLAVESGNMIEVEIQTADGRAARALEIYGRMVGLIRQYEKRREAGTNYTEDEVLKSAEWQLILRDMQGARLSAMVPEPKDQSSLVDDDWGEELVRRELTFGNEQAKAKSTAKEKPKAPKSEKPGDIKEAGARMASAPEFAKRAGIFPILFAGVVALFTLSLPSAEAKQPDVALQSVAVEALNKDFMLGALPSIQIGKNQSVVEKVVSASKTLTEDEAALKAFTQSLARALAQPGFENGGTLPVPMELFVDANGNLKNQSGWGEISQILNNALAFQAVKGKAVRIVLYGNADAATTEKIQKNLAELSKGSIRFEFESSTDLSVLEQKTKNLYGVVYSSKTAGLSFSQDMPYVEAEAAEIGDAFAPFAVLFTLYLMVDRDASGLTPELRAMILASGNKFRLLPPAKSFAAGMALRLLAIQSTEVAA